MTKKEVLRTLDREKIDTVIVGMVDHYGRLVGKRADVDFFKKNILKKGTHACDYLLTTDMEMNPIEGYASANWTKGYGDFHLAPDLATFRIASWLKRTAIVICDLYNHDHTEIAVSPRQILKHQLSRLTDLGYGCNSAHELEYYLSNDSYAAASEKNYHNLKASGWYLEDYHILQGTRVEKYTSKVRKHLKRSGIPVETSKGEWGLGQHEINIQYAGALEMADRHIIYKQCMKEIADKMGLSVTFMAKYQEEQAGSSCHIHLNLTKGGNNAFAGEQDHGGVKCSNEFLWFLGGWMKYMPEVMPFYAPTINSYKRYIHSSWAPTRLAWSRDNRTSGFRIVGSGESLRIECRIPGADCHPYLALAAAIASGISGIEQKIMPPPILSGNAYDSQQSQELPKTLESATNNLRNSSWAKTVLGADVIDHYCHFYQTEVNQYQQAVTDWERKRYYERI